MARPFFAYEPPWRYTNNVNAKRPALDREIRWEEVPHKKGYVFKGAHDAVFDSFVQTRSALAMAIAFVNLGRHEDGISAMDWSKPNSAHFQQPFRIIGVDFEGIDGSNHPRQCGITILESKDLTHDASPTSVVAQWQNFGKTEKQRTTAPLPTPPVLSLPLPPPPSLAAPAAPPSVDSAWAGAWDMHGGMSEVLKLIPSLCDRDIKNWFNKAKRCRFGCGSQYHICLDFVRVSILNNEPIMFTNIVNRVFTRSLRRSMNILCIITLTSKVCKVTSGDYNEFWGLSESIDKTS